MRHALLYSCTLVLSSAVALADEADPVAVQVGPRSVGAGEITRRLASIPFFQAQALGKDPDAIRRAFVETAVVPELLFSLEAERLALSRSPRVQDETKEVLGRALVRRMRADATAAGVPAADVRAYYDAHVNDYRRPERLNLARILVKDAETAQRVLSAVNGPEAAKKWSELCRELSLDAATKLRGGALGFVHPDGRTDVPQVAVDPALFAAANRVKDGELVREAVKEGDALAVIWRRGSLPAEERSFESEAPQIRELLARQRASAAVQTLLQDLRAREVSAVDPSPLDTWKPQEPSNGNPPIAPPPAASGSADPVPKETPRGLR